MTDEASKYLTVKELAELLRIKERKVYTLVGSGEIPYIRATRRLLFPREGVEEWLAHHRSGQRAAGKSEDRPVVLVGSHDPLLDWSLRESRSGIATFFDGSLDGLRRLRDGQAIAAGIHLFEPGAGEWNIKSASEGLPDAPIVLIEWAWRERGLIVAPGNPKAIAGLGDLAGKRIVPRQPEAGSQVLFRTLLTQNDMDVGAMDFCRFPARDEFDVAANVADAKADVGFGLAGVARQFRLGFVPIMRERYDIVVYRRAFFLAPFQRLMAFCRTDAFVEKAGQMGGYDISELGRVRFVGP